MYHLARSQCRSIKLSSEGRRKKKFEVGDEKTKRARAREEEEEEEYTHNTHGSRAVAGGGVTCKTEPTWVVFGQEDTEVSP